MRGAEELIDLLREKARTELARRVGTPEHTEYVRAELLKRLHAAQLAVMHMVLAVVRYIACECSRRAGKTTFAAYLILYVLLGAKRGQEVVFCAPTLARGKELIWDELEALLEEFGLTAEAGWRRTAASGKIRTKNGARFRIVGLDNKKQVGKIARGGNTILFVTDETQEFPHLLQALLVAAGPALAQSRGVFLALGTPTVNEADYWAAVCDGAEGFVRAHFTLRDNPYLGRDPDEILREERERHGWSEDHPTYVREYQGLRCKDQSLLVLEYSTKNSVKVIDGYRPDAYTIDLATPEQRARFERENTGFLYSGWRHFIGIDFGEHTAWVVLAAPLHGREVHVVHFEQAKGLTWDDVAERTKTLVTIFNPQGVVGDSATGGAQFMLTWNMRYGRELNVNARPASKHDKKASIMVLNTELRTQRMRVLLSYATAMQVRTGRQPKPGEEDLSGTRQLVKEATALQWEDEEKTEIIGGPAFPQHGFDAWRYAFNDFWAFMHPKQADEETDDQRRIRERNERESQRQASTRALRSG